MQGSTVTVGEDLDCFRMRRGNSHFPISSKSNMQESGEYGYLGFDFGKSIAEYSSWTSNRHLVAEGFRSFDWWLLLRGRQNPRNMDDGASAVMVAPNR